MVSEFLDRFPLDCSVPSDAWTRRLMTAAMGEDLGKLRPT
jgi:hypothetical protein